MKRRAFFGFLLAAPAALMLKVNKSNAKVPIESKTFSASGTFTKPKPYPETLVVKVWADGGSGGYAGSGGGTVGECIVETFTPVPSTIKVGLTGG